MWRRKPKSNNQSSSEPSVSKNNSPSKNNSSSAPDTEVPKKDEKSVVPDRQVSRQPTSEADTAVIQDEYERKIRVLSQCLEEKAEENITLYEQLRKLERRMAHCEKEAESAKDLGLVVSELNSMLRQKDEEFEKLKAETLQKDKERTELQRLNEEFQRRIRVLSTCLEEMAQENMDYWKSNPNAPKELSELSEPGSVSIESPSPIDTPIKNLTPEKSSLPGTPVRDVNVEGTPVEAKLIELTLKQDLERALQSRTELENELARAREELEQAEQKIQAKEKRIIQLNTKLMDAVNKKTSFQESNELYEQKLKSLEKELMENLHQEGIRRQEAEYMVSKLKKKVAELQFLLDKRDQDSDSSYYSEDDDFD